MQRGDATPVRQLHGPAEDMAHLPEGLQQDSSAEAEWGKPEVVPPSEKTSANASPQRGDLQKYISHDI